MSFKCCMPCKPPDRYPGCHDHCEKFRKEKDAHNQRKEELDRDRQISSAIYTNRAAKVDRAMRKRRSYKR